MNLRRIKLNYKLYYLIVIYLLVYFEKKIYNNRCNFLSIIFLKLSRIKFYYAPSRVYLVSWSNKICHPVYDGIFDTKRSWRGSTKWKRLVEAGRGGLTFVACN